METNASRIIAKCGGFPAVALLLNVDVSRVYRWTYPKAKGGTGGRIPFKHVDALIAGVRPKGIALTRDEFFTAD